MKVLIAADSSLMFSKGKYWCKTIYSYDFFERYLEVFDNVVVASRVKLISNNDLDSKNKLLRSDGKNVEIRELPDMHGMLDYIKKIIPFIKCANKATKDVDCAIFRLPSVAATMTLFLYKIKHKPYAIEVVADPYDAYKDNYFARIIFTYILRKECLKANGVSYVTKEYLQSKYPSGMKKYGSDTGKFESSYSTIRLKNNYFYRARKYSKLNKLNIIHTANNMNNDVKGHKTLILILKELVNNGYDVYCTFVGDGKLRKQFEDLCFELGLSNRVRFTGLLSEPESIRNELIKSDILVFPTKAEGLPRTIIEAMACGLPCISSNIAGIPELLEEEDMYNPEDIRGFVNRIIYLFNNPNEMTIKSSRNIGVAKNYIDDILRLKRNSFYLKLKELAIDKH